MVFITYLYTDHITIIRLKLMVVALIKFICDQFQIDNKLFIQYSCANVENMTEKGNRESRKIM